MYFQILLCIFGLAAFRGQLGEMWKTGEGGDGGQGEEMPPWRQQKHGTIMTTLDMNFLSELSQKSIAATLSPKATPQNGRMEYLCLSSQQRTQLHKVLNLLKTNMAGENSEYDTFVLHHDGQRSPSAHAGPSFVIWHRMFLFLFEKGLQRYFPNSSVPFFDNRLVRRATDQPRYSVMFSADLLGDPIGPVRSGPFANWTVASAACQKISNYLLRNVSRNSALLYNETILTKLHTLNSYEDICFPWNRFFEEMHGKIHVFVGGLMKNVMCAPFDPLFYLHHTFVDYVYEEYFRKPMLLRNKTITYPNISDYDLDKYYNATYRMLPFGITHNEMLRSVKFLPLYYKSPGDVVCKVDTDCCSNGNDMYVWCDSATNRCISKLVEGAPVSVNITRSCYCKDKTPSIVNGRCKCIL